MRLARSLLLSAVLSLSAPVAAQIPVELLFTVYSPNGSPSRFGSALAPFPDLDADGTPDLLVGASAERVQGQDFAGRAYVVSGASGAILQTFDGPPVEDAVFGWSVAHAGDLNGDGTPDAIVGAFLYPGSGEDLDGRAFLMSGATGDVLDVVAPAGRDTELGASVAALDDVDGDGVPDVAAGQTGDGSVLVASGATGDVLRTLYVDTDMTSTLGESLAVLGDLTGDGVREIAIGAPVGPGGPEHGQGRVYVVDPATGALVYTIANPTGVPIQQFGDKRTLAAVGDLDGDGLTDLAVGAPFSLRPDSLYGFVHLFSGATGALLRTCTEPGFIGMEVAAVGDLDGDGVPDVLTSGGPSAARGVVALSGATCAVLLEIASPFVGPLGFPTDIAAIRQAAGGEALIAIGGAGSLPGETEIIYRVFVYRVGGTVAPPPSPNAPGLAVSVSPVPSSGAAQVAVTLAASSSVRVAVVDALGRSVAVVHAGPLSAGRHRLALPPSLAPGVYAVRVVAGEASATVRWVVAR